MLGVVTNIEFLRFLLADADVRPAAWTPDCSTAEPPTSRGPAGREQIAAAAAYRWLLRWSAASSDPWDVPSGWRG